jgi:hypothetical protein
MAKEIEFVLNGVTCRLSRTKVEAAMKGVAAEPIQRHLVVIGGVRYPVKQVFQRVTGIDRLDFTSAIARRNLGKLGFHVARTNS